MTNTITMDGAGGGGHFPCKLSLKEFLQTEIWYISVNFPKDFDKQFTYLGKLTCQ